MIAPDGSTGDIPQERAAEAQAAGFKPAVVMTSPDGKMGYIPRERANDALKAGFKVGQPAVTQDNGAAALANPNQRFADPIPETGLLSRAANFGRATASAITSPILHPIETLEGMGKASIAGGMTPYGAPMRSPTGNQQNDANTEQAYRGVQNEVVQGAVQEIKQHPAYVAGGIIGPVLMGAGVAKTRLPAAVGSVAQKLAGKLSDLKPSDVMPGKQPNVMDAAANLSPKAVNAAEGVFQAAAPTGLNRNFRANVYAATPDLAEIGRNLKLQEAKGGIINPDMRVRATVNALDSYLSDMYQQERAPQIQNNAQTPLGAKFGLDAQEGLKFISKSGGSAEIRALAQKAVDGVPLTVAEGDKLAIAVNQNLKGFEAMSPDQRAAAMMTNRRMGSVKALDRSLSNGLNTTLQEAGEPGLQSYERRYAALSEIRDQLSKRMNAVELDRPGVIKGVVKPIASVLTGSKAGIASASQAAVADVNIGRTLQKAFADLAETDLKPKRSIRAQ
jgi:hypothetical protein